MQQEDGPAERSGIGTMDNDERDRMLRDKVTTTAFGKESGFRWRGTEVTRIEGFSDNVFGFALTLLVVSLEVPRTYADLQETFRGFIAFFLAFALLFSLWNYHYKFFRRYGLEDWAVTWLNAFLMFVILFFVYPLKFLFTFLVRLFSGFPTNIVLRDGSVIPSISLEQWPELMLAYGLGFIAIYGTFAMLYWYAYRQRERLSLDAVEQLKTRSSIVGHLANCLVAMISMAIITVWGPRAIFFSGMAYALIGPFQFLVGSFFRRRIDRLRVNA